MKSKLVIILLAVFCTAAFAIVYNEMNFSAGGREYQPIPEGQTPGQDNGPGIGLHHSGEDCGRCHRIGGRAESYLWTMSGTIYSDRYAGAALKGAEIVMEDYKGNVISMTSNRAGNFWTRSEVASDPYTVSTYHGHEPLTPLYTLKPDGTLDKPADPNNPSTWHYKTWVRKGSSVRPMLTIGGVGGNATMNRMTCNMHHAGLGSRGALWVAAAPTLPSYPPAGLNYRKHIYPILRSKCSPCHIPGSTVTSRNTRSDYEGKPFPAVEYSGGLDLMTYEGSEVPAPIYDAEGHQVGTQMIKKAGVLSVVKATPNEAEQSTLLQKTVRGGQPHAGGTLWNQRSPDYLALRQWISEGAQP
jgi:hypothetical protein